jgi:excisionase family DNA binding protein
MGGDHSYLSPRQAADYLKLSEAVFRLWRKQGRGPRFFNAGKQIRYRRADLDSWVEMQSGKQVEIQTASGVRSGDAV